MIEIWFVIAIFVFVYLQKHLYSKYIFKNVHIDRKFKEYAVFAGECVTYEFSIKNNKILPITYIKSEEKLFENIEFENIFSIMPFENVKRKYTIQSVKRGYYELSQGVKLTSSDLFGSEEYTSTINSHGKLTVYPKIIDIKNKIASLNTLQGDSVVKRWIIDDPMMISGIRDYTNTDSLKRINWKATAKTQELKVNTYEYTCDKKIMLIYNLDIHEYLITDEDIKNIESGIELAASICVDLINEGIPVGFTTNALCKGNEEYTFVEPSASQNQISQILTQCAKISEYKKYPLNDILERVKQSGNVMYEILIVTNKVSEGMLNNILQFDNLQFSIISVGKEEIEYIPNNVKLFWYRGEDE
ncbi:DUF58 domain-containing protein [Alkalithermobacter paradoxus]|uniref:DUF58 domain-containing protein n=1 Tax=Alkalithermobacter paradoxus TaxID=29349 RepID=A0A1V4I713_9FIRM|nr:hypothetical protein CLOTH_14530 [[Clostridium] thermoalcaliphilum]